MRLLLSTLLLCIATVAFAASNGMSQRWGSVDDAAWGDEYDEYFRKYSKRYFGPHFDWRWFKAQAIAESGLKHDAKSWVGAVGVMQIMPATFEEIRRANPHVGILPRAFIMTITCSENGRAFQSRNAC